jgi:hypothetical protein
LADLAENLPAGLDKKMVFHICGDTGGVKLPDAQQRVADAMEADARKNKANGEVAFFYHLGDVVYYNGLTDDYYPSFTRLTTIILRLFSPFPATMTATLFCRPGRASRASRVCSAGRAIFAPQIAALPWKQATARATR